MIHFLDIQTVINTHDELIETYGGLKGIRDIGLLESALQMPAAGIQGKYLHRTIYDKAAAYLYYITMNHPFLDGNKRTAVMSSLMFLSVNPHATFGIIESDIEDLVLDVAKGKIGKKEVCKFFHKAHKSVYN